MAIDTHLLLCHWNLAYGLGLPSASIWLPFRGSDVFLHAVLGLSTGLLALLADGCVICSMVSQE
eukprot:7577535-Alexandrium_andersonii.AAC.1